MSDSFSFSNTLSRDSIYESMSMYHATMEDAASRLAEGIKQNALSNEQIRKGDLILDTYHVEDEAIHGGMGSVWRVHHQLWDTDLAMKRPQPRFFAEAGEKRRTEFIAECDHWINLGLHPNIVSCYYVREIGGIPTIFSEWMDGGSLKDVIRSRKLYTGSKEEVQARILDIAIQTARGLSYSHTNGLLHQDVKPGNVLLTCEWEAKVADFGLARAHGQLSSEMQTSFGYTPEYCPKEQADGAPAEPWMDVYAWALTVLEMYLGGRTWTCGAEAFGMLLDTQTEYQVKPPQAFLDVCRRGFQETWDDFHALEQLLIKAYHDVTGAEYTRQNTGAAADVADTLNNRALSYLDLGMPEESEKLFEEALRIHPKHLNAFFNRILSQYRREIISYEEALKLLEEIDDPENRDICVNQLKTERNGNLKLPVEQIILPDSLDNLMIREDRFYSKACLHTSKDAKIVGGPVTRHSTEDRGEIWQIEVYDTVNEKTIIDIESSTKDSRPGSIDLPAYSISTDGKYLSTDCILPGKYPHDFFYTQVFELEAGKRIAQFEYSNGVLSPTGCFIAFRDNNNDTLRIMYVASHESIAFMENSRFLGFISEKCIGVYSTEKTEIQGWKLPDSREEGLTMVFSFTVENCPEKVFPIDENQILFTDDSSLSLFNRRNASVKTVRFDGKHAARLLLSSEKRYAVLISGEIMDVATGNEKAYFSRLRNEMVVEDEYESREVYYALILDLKEKRVLEEKKSIDLRQKEMIGRFLYATAHPESFCYIPGEKAEYRLSIIESTKERLSMESLFREHLSQARKLCQEGHKQEALQALDLAAKVPGFEASPEIYVLRMQIGEGLRKKMARQIVPVAVSYSSLEEAPVYKTPSVIPTMPKAEDIEEGKNAVIRLLPEEWDNHDLTKHWDHNLSHESTQDGRYILFVILSTQIYHVQGDPFDRGRGVGATRYETDYWDYNGFSNRVVRIVGVAIWDVQKKQIIHRKEIYKHDNHLEKGPNLSRLVKVHINHTGSELLIANGKTAEVIPTPLGNKGIPRTMTPSSESQIIECHYLDDDRFAMIMCEDGLMRIIRVDNMKWTEYAFTGELNGELNPVNDYVFYLERDDLKYHQCWIDWEYETGEPEEIGSRNDDIDDENEASNQIPEEWQNNRNEAISVMKEPEKAEEDEQGSSKQIGASKGDTHEVKGIGKLFGFFKKSKN